MKKIKLLKLNTMENGTIRLQSQLLVGSDTADFIMENGILKYWEYRKEGGFNFYETNIPYEIIENKKDMINQLL